MQTDTTTHTAAVATRVTATATDTGMQIAAVTEATSSHALYDEMTRCIRHACDTPVSTSTRDIPPCTSVEQLLTTLSDASFTHVQHIRHALQYGIHTRNTSTSTATTTDTSSTHPHTARHHACTHLLTAL